MYLADILAFLSRDCCSHQSVVVAVVVVVANVASAKLVQLGLELRFCFPPKIYSTMRKRTFHRLPFDQIVHFDRLDHLTDSFFQICEVREGENSH